ncbi:MAG: hypothetical protein Faunusvirus4_16 [Faunusvirus sp.]|jgi:thiol-disulfide isomerase/thioredoxin|uniref:Thioredoxin domain-containing protein n=1 Tax=Faunusvirus sp. TaxID=2487766 RepID=A0A3G4ZWB3_9VIRU|nr:MAG: hypothetical protein Faunusvirus4_16 [Faunusvirus sp.]
MSKSKRSELISKLIDIEKQYSSSNRDDKMKLLETARMIHGKLSHRLFHIQCKICDSGYCDGDTTLFSKLSVLENTVSDVAKIVKNMEMQLDDTKKSGGGSPSKSSVFKQVDDAYDASRSTVALFYAPWCGHSQQFLPIWSKFETQNKSNVKVNIFKVDCDKFPGLGTKYEVTGFPTVLFIDKDRVVEFAAERTQDNLNAFLTNYVK